MLEGDWEKWFHVCTAAFWSSEDKSNFFFIIIFPRKLFFLPLKEVETLEISKAFFFIVALLHRHKVRENAAGGVPCLLSKETYKLFTHG